jgi:enamine deaminase RidA (YjgF/YER057c/UK114 family)
VEINAIAIRDLSARRVLQVPELKPDGPYSAAVLAGNRLFVSGVTGESRGAAERKLDAVLKVADMKRRDVVLANEYAAGSRSEETVPVQSLPDGATHAIAAIAVKGGGQRRDDCTAADGAIFCAIQSSQGNEIEPAVRAAMDKLKARLSSGGFSPEQVLASNVYLDNLDHFKAMNAIYGGVFASDPPTRTTVQPLVSSGSTLFRISVIAGE